VSSARELHMKYKIKFQRKGEEYMFLRRRGQNKSSKKRHTILELVSVHNQELEEDQPMG
jgi:hypothetical protein